MYMKTEQMKPAEIVLRRGSIGMGEKDGGGESN
jgi:hypothetical protein